MQEALADGFMEVSLQLDAQSSVASPPEATQGALRSARGEVEVLLELVRGQGRGLCSW